MTKKTITFFKSLLYFEISKIVLSILNLVFLVKSYPEISIIIGFARKVWFIDGSFLSCVL